MARHKRQLKAAAVEPELPITPFLDMSFQLLAFFVITFKPMDTEAQLPLALPKLEGGEVPNGAGQPRHHATR